MGDIILAGSTSGSITVAPPAVAGSGTLTLPTGTDTLVGLAATQTLTNKTLTAPALGTPASGVLTNCTGSATGLTAGYTVSQILHVRDEKTANTSGGTSAAGNQTRTLNTVVNNTITGASLATNQITLPAGQYRIYASAPAYHTAYHRLRLVNVTDSAVTLLGTSSYNAVADDVTNISTVIGVFTTTAVKVFTLTHYTSSANASGLGVAVNDTFVEVYALAIIEKIGA